MKPLQFTETMRGTISREGREHPIEFTVTARGEGRGFFALEGTADAAPWAKGPATGSLRISFFGLERFIRYHLLLPGGFVLQGEKTPSPFKPLRSMTVMPVKLTGPAGELIAEGTMSFALKELPAFVLSTFPVGR